MNAFIKENNIKIIIVIICFAIAGIQGIRTRTKNQKDLAENYIQETGTISRVSMSGNRIHTSTLLTIHYTHNRIEKTAVIRRSGYSENRYKKGDTITIWINKNDTAIIK